MHENVQQLLDDAKLLKVKSEKYMEGRIDAIHEVMEIWRPKLPPLIHIVL